MSKLSHHQKHEIRRWFHQRSENMLDLLDANEMGNCEICAPENAQWFYDQGYSEEERQAICALICPPHGDVPPPV